MGKDIVEYTENPDYLLISILTDNFGLNEINKVNKENTKKIEELFFPNVIIDLDMVSYIDTSAIGFIVNLKKTIDKHWKKFSMVCSNSNLIEIASIMKLDKFIDMHEKLDQAVEAITS